MQAFIIDVIINVAYSHIYCFGMSPNKLVPVITYIITLSAVSLVFSLNVDMTNKNTACRVTVTETPRHMLS